ncbi:MAG: 4-phosphoerythronate dehydrogenase [Ignavibacteriae bacterium]|nr:4-phosphoerythronate dehydrogenase [Ignavibacteriota bacterium]
MLDNPTIIVNAHTPQAVELFSRLGNVVPLETSLITNETVKKADVLIIRSETKIDKHLLDESSVRFVGTVTAGTDHLDTGYLASKGIIWTSAPGSNSNSVAEYVVAAMLVWSERIGKSLKGKTLGVVGVGNVGSKVVRFAQALGMNVLLNDPPLARVGDTSSFLSLDELMNADIITIHVPLTNEGVDRTYHLFNEERLRNMKRGSVLINTSRGAVVETAALLRALTSNHVSTALLDVWEGEPNIPVDVLTQVMLGTPHIAGYSLDGKLNALRNIYRDVSLFLGKTSDANFHGDEQSTKIIIPGTLTDTQAIVAYAVNKAYNIEVDDTALRRIVTVPTNEQGSYFRKLRASYRTRREFNQFTVHLSREQASARKILETLGFNVHL